MPGKATLSVALSRKARAQLASRGRLATKVTVAHSKVALDRTVTLKLTHTKRKSTSASHARRAVASGARGRS